jgi:hypothetical protein
LKGAFTDNFRWVIGLCGATGGGAIGGGGRNGGGGDLIDLMLERDPFELGPLVAIFQAGMCELIGLNTCERETEKKIWKKVFETQLKLKLFRLKNTRLYIKRVNITASNDATFTFCLCTKCLDWFSWIVWL